MVHTHERHLAQKEKGGRDMITSKGCFWIATMRSEHRIWGIGKSEREAIQSALEHIGGNRFTPVLFECMPCTSELYHEIDHHGATGLTWELHACGVASLVDAI